MKNLIEAEDHSPDLPFDELPDLDDLEKEQEKQQEIQALKSAIEDAVNYLK